MYWTLDQLVTEIETLLFGDFPNLNHPRLQIIESHLQAVCCLNSSHAAFVDGLLAYYRRQFSKAAASFAQVDRQQLAAHYFPLLDACTLAAKFRVVSIENYPVLLQQMTIICPHVPTEIALFLKIQICIQLRLCPQYHQVLEQTLTTVSADLATTRAAVQVQAYYYLAIIYTTVLEAPDAGMDYAYNCFLAAQKFGFLNYEFSALSVIAELYEHLQLRTEALRYYTKLTTERLYTPAISTLRALAFLNIAMLSVENHELAIAEHHLGQMQPLLSTSSRELQLLLIADVTYLRIAVKKAMLPPKQLLITLNNLIDRYRQFGSQFSFTALEPTFFMLGAEIAKLSHLAHDQQLQYALTAHYLHLRFLQVHTPAKKYAIAQVFKMIAQSYVELQDHAEAMAFYHQYQTTFQLWQKNNHHKHTQIRHKQLSKQIQQRERQIAHNWQKTLQTQHDYDALTGLFSRRQLNNIIEQVRPSGYYLCDLDHFKLYNDTYGHLAGDDLLRKISALITETLTPQQLAFRYGGEEFLILSFDANFEHFQTFVKQLHQAIQVAEIAFPEAPTAKTLTVSAGCFWNVQNLAFADAFVKADELLYQAKAAGRNQFCTNFEQLKLNLNAKG